MFFVVKKLHFSILFSAAKLHFSNNTAKKDHKKDSEYLQVTPNFTILFYSRPYFTNCTSNQYLV